MARVRGRLRVLVCACLTAFIWAAVGDASGATKQGKESTPVSASVKPAKQQSKQGHYPPIQHVKKSPIPTVTERPPETTQKQAKPIRAELKLRSSKNPRRMKLYKKEAPKAVVQPRTDLMYHGMLESPQRYDPRRNHSGAGVPDPHTPEVTHDHFQELDRNQDGSIDPVERTFGRPDMERDLSTHQRQ